jgi:hypothetical protein
MPQGHRGLRHLRGGSTAALADILRVLHEALIVREVLLEVPGILQEAEMLFVTRMGHLNLGHFRHFLPVMAMCFLLKDSRMAVRCSKGIPICTRRKYFPGPSGHD